MKNIIALALLAGVSFANAQELDQYKYFNLSEKSADFPDNQYQLNSRLNYYLGKKNYTIINDDRSKWPADVNTKQCNVVGVDLVKQKSMLKNKLEIQFKDCNNNVIKTFEGTSTIKEFDKGYQDALKIALNKIKVYKYSGKETEEIPTLAKEDRFEPQPVIKDETSSTVKPDKFEPQPVLKDEIKYDTNIKKVDLKEGGFLLMNATTMQTLAQFDPTLRKSIYRVTVFNQNGEKYPSIGYTEGNSISFEFLENGSWKAKNIKLY